MPSGAIITADIVNSTMLLPDQEKKLIRLLSLELKGYKFEFYRGDSFQVYIKDASLALKTVLKLRAIASSFSPLHDVRASIGIGEVKVPVRFLKTSTSDAFIISGRAFDELLSGARLQIRSAKEDSNLALRVIGYFCDYIFKRFTPKQAAVVHQLLSGHTQIEAARRLKISQATLNKHAQSAGWAEIEKILEEYRKSIMQFKLL
ncbi:MAG: hypothetical protein WCF67_23505 [Chitinophagaceae bacterium]